MQCYWQVLFLALQCWHVLVLTVKMQKGRHLSVGKYHTALHFYVCIPIWLCISCLVNM